MGTGHARVGLMEEVKVSDPIGNVNGASECDDNLVFFWVISDIPKCAPHLIIDLSDLN